MQNLLRLPITGKLIYANVHLHRYARHVRLEDDEGTVVYEGDTIEDSQRRLVRVPVYSNAAGLPVKRGGTLLLSVTYDNPLAESIGAMATVHLFMHQDVSTP